MPESGRAVRVVDPVHGYINLTPIERALLDSRPAQRLRYVGQSGLAHLVFPDLRTSRFVHSLGAMHLASRFLAGSLQSAAEQDRKAAEEAVKEAVSNVLGTIPNARDVAAKLDPACLSCGQGASDSSRPYLLLAEQGLRLAALFHDLGHLPFSHDFEYAIDQLAGEEKDGTLALIEQGISQEALHERIGHHLTYLLIKEEFAHDPSETARVTFELARRILETNEAQTAQTIAETGGLKTPAEGALAWLHTLIAGELDVDRCDYVLRDARSYAFESAYYDLERLIYNLTVVKHPEIRNALVPAVRPQGQPAIESFLIARSRIYQWGPRHHKVAQVAAALRYSIGEMLRPAVTAGAAPGHPLRPFLADLEKILGFGDDDGDAGELLGRFAGYDDQWWMGQMRERADNDPWFNLVCWRTPGPTSLWKRTVDFPEGVALAEWNRRLPVRTQIERLKAWDEAVRSLREHGVLIVRHRFEPWKPSEATKKDDQPQSALSFYDPKRGLMAVTQLSYPVAALREAWMRDLQVHAFASGPNPAISAHEVLEHLTKTADED
jgi:HD superfamily phosphohydrolase